MIRGLRNLFSNMPIGRKLGISFGILVSLTLLVGAVSFIANNAETNALEQLQRAEQEVILAEQAEIDLLQARRREKDFLLRYRNEGIAFADENYVQVGINALEALRADIEGVRELETLENHEEALALLDEIDASIDIYQQDVFVDAFAVVSERGTLLEPGTLDTLLSGWVNLGDEAAAVGDFETSSAAYEVLDLNLAV